MASFIDEYAFTLRKNWRNSAIFRITVCMSFYLLALPMTTRVCIRVLIIAKWFYLILTETITILKLLNKIANNEMLSEPNISSSKVKSQKY